MNALKNNNATIKNLHLIISIIFIVPIALIYGLYPNVILLKLFDIKIETINLANILRAMMGLYLGLSTIWIIGIINPKFWTTATLTNIAFMGGLAFGRLLSLALDGFPSIYFLAGLLLELFFAFWGVQNIKKYRNFISI
jgi:Domain of unknown function (DUF4345)